MTKRKIRAFSQTFFVIGVCLYPIILCLVFFMPIHWFSVVLSSHALLISTANLIAQYDTPMNNKVDGNRNV